MQKLLTLLVLALCAIPAFQPASALQGGSVGTLPRHQNHQSARWLTAWQTLSIQSEAGATLVITSTHNGEDLAQSPPQDPQVLRTSWRCRHMTMTVETPRWGNEVGDEGASHQWTRHAQAVTQGEYLFPPDGT